MNNRRVFIGITIALLIFVLFALLPANNFLCLTLLISICCLALLEFYNLLAKERISSSKKLGITISIIFCIATWLYMIDKKNPSFPIYNPDIILWSIIILIIILIFCRLLTYDDTRLGLDSALGTLLGFIYVTFLFSFFIRIFLIGNNLNDSAWIAFYCVLCTKISDTGGYFIGLKFGRHKLAKKISPKKTWEGVVGGFFFCLVINLIWLNFIDVYIGKQPLPIIHAIVLSFLFPIFGTAGDLVESLFKRAVKEKDSGESSNPLGGILDMIDSLLFTAPMFYIYLEFLLV